MPSLTAKKEDLRKTFSIVSLASSDQADKVTSHSLIKARGGKAVAYATDGDRMAFSDFPVTDSEGDMEFTVDPKKMLAVISSADVDDIKMDYNQEAKTVGVYASEHASSILSFPSFSPEEFLSFESELAKASATGSVNTEMLQMGLKFIQGFLPDEKSPKSEKYARLYASKGVLYGANGSNKIGAFQSDELSSLDDLIIRRAMMAPVTQMIEKAGSAKIAISTTSRMVFMASADGSSGFGFLRTNDAMPKYPITTDDPQCDGFNASRSVLMKKLGRLAITANDDLGIRSSIEGNTLHMSTVTERVSNDAMECKRVRGDQKIEFVYDYKLMKSILTLFQASNVDMYVDKFKCSFVSQAEIEIVGTKERKPFKAVALMSLARAL